MPSLAVSISGFALIIVLLRVSHLLASDLWILFRGKKWLTDLKRLSPTRRSNAHEVWKLYDKHDAGKLPYLFMGIKSYRLQRWASLQGGLTITVLAFLAKIGRVAWRFFWFPLITTTIAIAVAATSSTEAVINIWLAIQFLLLAGFVLIGVEIVLAGQVLQSWASWYHQWPRMPALKTPPQKPAETALFVGVVMLAFVSAVGLVMVAGNTGSAFIDFPDSGNWLVFKQLTFSALRSLPVIGLGSAFASGEQTALSSLVDLAIGVAWLALGFFGWGIHRKLMT